METKIFDEFEDIKEYWLELWEGSNPSIFNDYETNKWLYELALEPSKYGLVGDCFEAEETEIYVVHSNKKLVGVVPLAKVDGDWFMSGNGLLLSFIPPIQSNYLVDFMANVNRGFSFDDVNPFYLQDSPNMFYSDANIIDLRELNSFEDYLMSIKGKRRNEFRKVIKNNLDIEVVVGFEERDWLGLCVKHNESWKAKTKLTILDYMNITDRLTRFESETCYAQSFTIKLNGKAIAINRALVIDNHLYDYICVKDSTYDARNIGILAILKNIELAILNKVDYYNLGQQLGHDASTANALKYKKKFINADFKGPNGMVFNPGLPQPPYYDLPSNKWML